MTKDELWNIYSFSLSKNQQVAAVRNLYVAHLVYLNRNTSTIVPNTDLA